VQYADVPAGGSLAVIGLGPIGEMCTRVAQHLGVETVIGLDLVPERLARSAAHGVHTIDVTGGDDVLEAVRALTGGRGPDGVIDAVGMEAHGAPLGRLAQTLAGYLPDAVARKAIETAGVDRLAALHLALDLVRRGGTVSLSGVYGGAVDPMNLMQMFDKQLTLRMGQANVRRWVADILPLLDGDEDPLGVDGFATHHVPLADAPAAYDMFQGKEDGAFKVVFKP
jgi:threonine dehydrogenase-like Zn-dependent dehydrogenase